MEVAALRTLYLLKASPDQTGGRPANLGYFKSHAKDCAQPPRQRTAANVSETYRKVLTELRAAFIAGQEDRINELSDQLEELTKDEQPDLDDAVEITDQARKDGPVCLRSFDAGRIAEYIAAYGADFPDPFWLMFTTARGDLKSKKQSPEQWKETRAFVIKQVSWQVGGLDQAKQEKISEQVAKVLDRAYPLSDDEIRKEFAQVGKGLRAEIAAITNLLGPTDVIKHVVEQDFAELLSNPRLLFGDSRAAGRILEEKSRRWPASENEEPNPPAPRSRNGKGEPDFPLPCPSPFRGGAGEGFWKCSCPLRRSRLCGNERLTESAHRGRHA